MVTRVSLLSSFASTGLSHESYRRGIISCDPDIHRMIDLAEKAAQTDISVLITGETGVGKELFAQIIHEASSRLGPLEVVNCSAIPSELLESELFGHEQGSFTGAAKRHKGVFERAQGGTVFLDEIGDLSKNLQAKLLRVLDRSGFYRVGGDELLQPDFRLVSATNVDLRRQINLNAFREDLYYRLNPIELNIKPLRARKGDVDLLVSEFIRQFCKKYGLDHPVILGTERQKIRHYQWPGNVRELINVIERSLILSDPDEFKFFLPGRQSRPMEIFEEIPGENTLYRRIFLEAAIAAASHDFPDNRLFKEGSKILTREFRIRLIQHALEEGESISAAARILGVSRSALYHEMEIFEIQLQPNGNGTAPHPPEFP